MRATTHAPETPLTLHPPEAAPFFWRCAACGRRTPFGYDQLFRFARGGWPACCGQEVLGGEVAGPRAGRGTN